MSMSPSLTKITVLTLCTGLLLNACGQRSAPAAFVPNDNQERETTLGKSQPRLEAEHASLGEEAELGSLMTTDPSSTNNASVITDAAASGGTAVRLASTGSTVRFTVPAGVSADQIVRVQARAVAANGNPVIKLMRGTTLLAKQELVSASYAPLTFGTFRVSAGQTLKVTLTNGLTSGTRQAVVDFLIIDPLASPAPAPEPIVAPAPAGSPIKLPPAGRVAWDWQIGASGDSTITVPTGVSLLDVDGFTTSAAKVAQLKAAGVYTVCYINAGSYEPYRPDSAQYPDYLKIQRDADWPDEYFLDINDVWKTDSVLAKILRNRFQMCKDKGFDAIEPDNLQNDENVSGGLITTQQQLNFNGWVADEAHALGLAVFQKNGPDKVLLKDTRGRMMVDVFDGILNEECQQYNECSPLAEYVKRGKLALNVEYSSGLVLNCTQSNQLVINSMKKDLDLVGGTMTGYKRESC